MDIEQIANDNKDRFKSKKVFKRIAQLLDVANENKLDTNDTCKLIDAFEKLGVTISFGTGC